MDGLPKSRVRYAAGALLLSLFYALFFWNSPFESPATLVRRDALVDHDLLVTENVTLVARDEYACSKKKPCSNGACCGKDGWCGYGPTYCGKGCQSNCDAQAECGKYAPEGKEKCPLNVCCSEFGFCGTTEEFCSGKCQNNCGTPSLPAGKSPKSVRNKVIAYYESWASSRKCKAFQPWSIPINGVTHVNFAFAYIDPKTFEITTMDSTTPETLFQQTAGLKSEKAGLHNSLEVWISIGGWTFSDNHTDTQAVFGEIARDEDNRQKFADNLVTFMTRYGFDGADLDWEYPGAPDRGGKKDDTKSLVKLIRTLKSTFERSPRGGYGLSFTIPSSYWYLRWFDVPGMLDAGADWVNLMSYDLHGVWDEHNPIGSYVHGHTNLTEIKQSVELLWRNDVPPEKVVLGTGFYGRSFQLKDKSCNKPGCAFKGAARKGECTGEGGILGYFEIMDILKKNKDIEVIHDKEAAVNYFSWDDDQWISYDDKKTFGQKVKWADDIGLGGLMTWAIDLDDDKFTALEGLIGRDPGTGLGPDPEAMKDLTGDWSSDNGQECYSTGCSEMCPSDTVVLDTYTSNCGALAYKRICCPRGKAPRECQWRGGETGGPGRACHGTCHDGELTLFYDGAGSRYCATGQQAYCCTADRYKDLLDGCRQGGCGGGCDDDEYKVAEQYDFGKCWKKAWTGYHRPWCCKKELKNCHWVGSGSCDHNHCKGEEVQLSSSVNGNNANMCGAVGRKKSLCCDPPEGMDLFTLVPLENLFPDPPPITDSVKWDLQVLGGYYPREDETTTENPTGDPDLGAFGLVLIVGPKEKVSSFSKRDGSHIEVVDCPSITNSERQTARIICTDDGEESNCDDILEGGVDGTVVRMPENCGPGTYAVAHSLTESEDQRLPDHLTKRMAVTKRVMELEFSYDFTRVKRDDDRAVKLRIDYSNIPGYWSNVVEAEGEKKRKRSMPRELSQRDLLEEDIHKRFFSDDSKDWANKFDDLDDADYHTAFGEPVTQDIFNEKLDCDEESYLTVKSDGGCQAKAKFGFTFIGTLAPFDIEQAWGFVDLKYDLDARIQVTGNAGMDTEFQTKSSNFVPNTEIQFSHPGIVSINPSFDIHIGVKADGASFSGDMTTHFRAQSDPSLNNGWIRLGFPHSVGGSRGGVKSYKAADAFEGHMKTDKGRVSLSLNPEFDMGIDFGGLADSQNTAPDDERDLERRSSSKSIAYLLNIYNPNTITWDVTGVDYLADAAYFALTRDGQDSITDWASMETPGQPIGEQPGLVTLHNQRIGESGKAPAYKKKTTPYKIFDADVLTCPAEDSEPQPGCRADLCKNQVIACDEEKASAGRGQGQDENEDGRLAERDGGPSSRREADWKVPHSQNKIVYVPHANQESGITGGPRHSVLSLDKRDPTGATGGARDAFRARCKVDDEGHMRGVSYTNLNYPSVSDWETDDERYDSAYDAGDWKVCTDGSIKGHSLPHDGRYYVTEHIMELQTMKMFLNDVSKSSLPGGGDSGLDQIYCDFIQQLFNKDLLKDTDPPVTPGSETNDDRPIVRIMQVIGWQENWKDFVFLERAINAYKKLLWQGNDPVAATNRPAINHSLTRYSDGLVNIRTVINVFNYMNDQTVHGNWVRISNNIQKELQRADDAWVKQKKKDPTDIAKYWNRWIRAHMKNMAIQGKAYAAANIADMRAFWEQIRTGQLAPLVRDMLNTLEGQLGDIKINLDGLAAEG